MPEDGRLSISNPEYQPIEPALSENEISHVFRINGGRHEKSGDESSEGAKQTGPDWKELHEMGARSE